MKIGIYIPGLGESYKDESILKYATRFMHEIDWNHQEARNIYSLKHETIFLGFNSSKKELNKLRTTKVSIVERKPDYTESVIYSFYDLPYEGILTDKFNSSNIFRKSFLLMLTIIRKFPRIFLCVVSKSPDGYFSTRKRFQSFYAFVLLILIGMGGILLIPSFITVFSSMDALPAQVSALLKKYLDNRFWNDISHYIIAGSIILFTIARRINSFISALTVKLVCTHYYLQLGDRKQAILGHLDHLLEFIAEHEDPEATVHLHACDFGAVVCYDFLFPSGTVPTERTRQKVTCFCTISFPYEFISSYYPLYFKYRDNNMCTFLAHWYNIFSMPDFFSTKLKAESFQGSINNKDCFVIPHNLHYDIVPRERSVFDFIAFFSFKTYQYYWDDATEGTSCLRLLVREMMQDNFL
jgi:hypothetical protein